ncbi:Metacaspase type II [Mycena sanguinolenta]|uniref:Metacaspase type II n=1 Tax=Mycena sanguinolenta TaxID=230812 RepID=A0A8H6XYC1_9AGAR|nr:Metacaspase type II [Mycena sanguinolenta]
MSHRPTPAPAMNQEYEPSALDPCARVEGQSYKALLIGIRGTTFTNEEYPELIGTHNDVENVRDLLIDHYDYRAPDITVLIDDGVAGNPQPTRANILKAIGDLVKEAKAGDHIYFHYCGHSMQIPNGINKDECLIPCDGPDQHIVDNDLHAALVLPLPAGCQLVTVLDACHSGSLLDLKHHRCNRVAVPWTWRDGGIIRSGCGGNARIPTILPGRKAIQFSSSPPTGPSSTRLLVRSSESKMNLSPRTASSSLDRHARAKARASGSRGPRRTYTYCASTISLGSPNDGGAVRSSESDDVLSLLGDKFWVLPEEHRRCDSPVAFECTGWCREADQAATEAENFLGGILADVICLASCKDRELRYEDENGRSMTSSLVKILRRKPYQSLKEVLLSITSSHAMHAEAEKRHDNAKYKEEFRAWKAKLKAKLAPAEKKNALDHRTMSLVSPEAPPLRLPPLGGLPPPDNVFRCKEGGPVERPAKTEARPIHIIFNAPQEQKLSG